jgi:hypothetical protein
LSGGVQKVIETVKNFLQAGSFLVHSQRGSRWFKALHLHHKINNLRLQELLICEVAPTIRSLSFAVGEDFNCDPIVLPPLRQKCFKSLVFVAFKDEIQR